MIEFIKSLLPRIYLKLTIDGSSVVCEPNELPSYFVEAEEKTLYESQIKVVWMSLRRYEQLPEFDGF